jgi:hypothetical protein
VRVEKGIDVAVLLDFLKGGLWADKGDIIEAFGYRQLYVIRAKLTNKAID